MSERYRCLCTEAARKTEYCPAPEDREPCRELRR